MDEISVGIIIIIAGYFSLKRFLDKLKPGSGGCGNGCSCGSVTKNCSMLNDKMPK
ncbi:MAG: hypothetical protein KKD44_04200 [Proteobacteria bacterium]|nr:hypothetical protein [Pseudomonadota bacterium]